MLESISTVLPCPFWRHVRWKVKGQVERSAQPRVLERQASGTGNALRVDRIVRKRSLLTGPCDYGVYYVFTTKIERHNNHRWPDTRADFPSSSARKPEASGYESGA